MPAGYANTPWNVRYHIKGLVWMKNSGMRDSLRIPKANPRVCKRISPCVPRLGYSPHEVPQSEFDPFYGFLANLRHATLFLDMATTQQPHFTTLAAVIHHSIVSSARTLCNEKN